MPTTEIQDASLSVMRGFYRFGSFLTLSLRVLFHLPLRQAELGRETAVPPAELQQPRFSHPFHL